MNNAPQLASGKNHSDENFPVASVLIHPRHRAPIMAFYHFARAADDVADHEHASPDEKLHLLDDMRLSLLGQSESSPVSAHLHHALSERGLTNQHGLDLLEAFRRDVTKLRYQNWDELMDYCRYSAMPVGRFVLDVHGESQAAWPRNDALCAALQIINHLQDCGKDYRQLNRVYIPEPLLQKAGLTPAAFAADKACPALLAIIRDLARKTAGLLEISASFADHIKDLRLGLEVAVIQKLAEDLNTILQQRDPLSQKVHHSKARALGQATSAAISFLLCRPFRGGRA